MSILCDSSIQVQNWSYSSTIPLFFNENIAAGPLERILTSGTLIGFFTKQADARSSLWALNKNGYRRAAILHRSPGGEIHIFDCFTLTRAIGLLASILFASLIAYLLNLTGFIQLLFARQLPLHTIILTGAIIGTFTGLVWIRRSKFGIETKILDNYIHCLMPDESALILEAPVDAMKLPMTIIRDKSESLPTIFVLHPIREHRVTAREHRNELSVEEISRHARHRAIDHQLQSADKGNVELLQRLKKEGAWFQEICADLTEACRLEQGASPVAEWIIDNEFLVAKSIRDVLVNLPKSYYRELPVLSGHEYWTGLPCIYELAKELVFDNESRLNRENILTFINAYQTINKLTIGELWAVPQMLRIALVESILDLAIRVHNDMRERQLATFWANRFIAANRRDSAMIFSVLNELDDRHPDPSPYFCSQLISLLYDQAAALAPVENWLHRKLGKSANEINFSEQNRQARDQLLIEAAFSSVRQLAQIDWRDIFEELSWVEKILSTDPTGIYPSMDFQTRDNYRQIVKRFALRSGRSEDDVARVVVEIAATSDSHIGTVLLGQQKKSLEEKLRCQDSLGQRLYTALHKHHTGIYFSGLLLFWLPIYGIVCNYALPELTPGLKWFMALLLLIPTSQLALEILNYLITRLISPRALPKMDFEKSGVPEEFKTLVIVPTLLVHEKSILHEIEKLEIRFMANRDPNLRYGLFTDYTDSTSKHNEDDEKLLQLAVNNIKVLNRRYQTDSFYLFHRERTWCDSEQKFIGWERKRGKLEELNKLIDGSCPESADDLVHAGNPEHLFGTRFIITLDSDTQLPHGTARRMIETLAHPINQPRIDNNGKIAEGTYTILQPRVTASLPSSSKSPFSQIYADAVGVDPYTRVVSDVYQDLTGEGSYHGKGIYDVRAFSKILSGNFPDELVLSHDLIEGAHVRTALVSDIELFDDFPQDYLGYITRLRRWVRGDWQIFGWVFPWVPHKGGGFRKNPISLFNRWKVLDNLRRSLLLPCNLTLLIIAWLTSHLTAEVIMLLIGIQIFFGPLLQIFSALTTRKGLRNFAPSTHINHLQRALAEIALLPHQAWVTSIAILQAWYRLFISHRKLLEWTTAYAAQSTIGRRRTLFAASLLLASISSSIITISLIAWMPSNLLTASPWLLLWFFSPFFGWLLTSRPKEKSLQELLPGHDILFLRRITRLTWRFFAEFVNDGTSWLPPDNYQVSHQDQLAMRTSPTNIGFWMLSTLAAHDSGYLTQDRTLDKLHATMHSLQKLERYEGHLLNWYDIQSLAPLEPRYVSSVDSGNFLGSLWTLQQGLKDQFNNEIINKSVFSGLHDTGRMLQRILKPQSTFKQSAKELKQLLEMLEKPPRRTFDQLTLLKQSKERAAKILAPLQLDTSTNSELHYWANALKSEIDEWLQTSERYLGWIVLLGKKQDNELARAAIKNLSEIEEDLADAPSLQTLARGLSASIPLLTLINEHAHSESAALANWANEVLESFATAQRHAGIFRERHERLLSDIRKLAGEINLKFLYDPERKLFSIGYNVSTEQMDNSYYDLLASEARFGGYVAIARGDVPMEHWFTMGRPHALIGRHRVLLSWTGTMFEYLMPQIFLRSYRYSLLDKATRNAIETQIAFGRKNRIPWGISESAFGDLDFNKTYQYKAFGVPKLGLKRVLEDQLVVSPYSTMMAVGVMPKETVENLRTLEKIGMLDDYGFYESIDFRRKPERSGHRGVMIKAYMAHHQGMGFLAMTNFLHNNVFQRRFHTDPRARAFEPLLQEKIPTLPPIQLTASRERSTSQFETSSDIPASGTFETPHTSMPKTQIICNGRYDLMITNTGGGYSKWRGQEISRWRADRTTDQWGSFCYLHDLRERDIWSATYHPIDSDIEKYDVEFAMDRAIFRKIKNSIQLETEVIVAPEDDVEIRRMTFINRSGKRRRLNLTSYIELSMADHAADRAHPAFNKLFIQTEAIEETRTLLAYRRPRSEDAAPFFVSHCFVNRNRKPAGHLKPIAAALSAAGKVLPMLMVPVGD
jgi:cyclic beta-1,2-glucan synthetase